LKKIFMVGICVIMLVFAACGGGVQAEQELAQERFDTYVETLIEFREQVLEGGEQAELLSGGMAGVWRSAIDDRRDFNDALSAARTTDFFIENSAEISAVRSTATSLFLQLDNAPEGLERTTAIVDDMFSAFDRLVELAINPTGSFNSFSSDRREAIDELARNDRLLGSILDSLELE